MNDYRVLSPSRSLRWFFLMWLTALYIWGLVNLMMRGKQTGNGLPNCTVIPAGSDGCILRYAQGLHDNIQADILFTLLMFCFGVLVWVGASEKKGRSFYWFSFLLQVILAFLVLLSGPPLEVGLILFLVLVLGGATRLERTRLIVVVACSSFVFFFVVLLASLHQWRYIVPVHISDLSSIAIMLLLLGGYLVLYVQVTTAYAHLEGVHKELAAAHTRLKASTEQIEELTRLTERQRLARELHDTLAQGLAGVMMQLQAANSRLNNRRYEHAQEAIQQAISDVRETLGAARSAIGDLRAEASSFQNLGAVVEERILQFTLLTGIPCTTDLSACSSIPEQLSEQVLKTISEGLTNVTQHAHASHVWIRVVQEAMTVTLEIRDDGIGFDPAMLANQSGHYGLLGLGERAHLMEGVLSLMSTPHGGATLRLCFPLPTARTENTRLSSVPGERKGSQ
ncbi:MAG TPA: sensor histidine kinase [Ktedonosporobacter sp.]|nr:sensor histidine kinase [Ktedonosporobacter sp.]